jgi:S-adenosylmethionine-dependent methyltransferase
MTDWAQVFGDRLPAFKELQDAPWGRLRYSVALANLQRHLGEHPLRILDAGGGNGVEAIHLAAQGHAVTLVDLTGEMLAEARRNAEAGGVAGRMAFHQADLTAIPGLFPEAQFDLVLCHNVLQYAGDLGAATDAVCRPLRPGGLISVICVNRYSEPYRQALMRLDLDAAYASLDAETVVAYTFGVPVRAYIVEDLVGPLEKVGCAVIGRYGVRCVNDYIFDNDIKSDPAFFARLERLELALTDRYPYYLLARFFQIIARKTAEE